MPRTPRAVRSGILRSWVQHDHGSEVHGLLVLWIICTVCLHMSSGRHTHPSGSDREKNRQGRSVLGLDGSPKLASDCPNGILRSQWHIPALPWVVLRASHCMASPRGKESTKAEQINCADNSPTCLSSVRTIVGELRCPIAGIRCKPWPTGRSLFQGLNVHPDSENVTFWKRVVA